MPESQSRLERINEQYKKQISQIINYELKNPNATGLISVTKVKVTNDLKLAKVYVSILNAKAVSYTHLRAPETAANLVCRLLLEKKIDNILKKIMPKKEEEN